MLDQDIICPKINEPCRHCSVVKVARPFTKLIKMKDSKMYQPGGLGKTIITVGEYCNNDGTKYVKDIVICPMEIKPEIKSGLNAKKSKVKVARSAKEKTKPEIRTKTKTNGVTVQATLFK